MYPKTFYEIWMTTLRTMFFFTILKMICVFPHIQVQVLSKRLLHKHLLVVIFQFAQHHFLAQVKTFRTLLQNNNLYKCTYFDKTSLIKSAFIFYHNKTKRWNRIIQYHANTAFSKLNG